MMFRSRHEMWATTSMAASSCTILAATDASEPGACPVGDVYGIHPTAL